MVKSVAAVAVRYPPDRLLIQNHVHPVIPSKNWVNDYDGFSGVGKNE